MKELDFSGIDLIVENACLRLDLLNSQRGGVKKLKETLISEAAKGRIRGSGNVHAISLMGLHNRAHAAQMQNDRLYGMYAFPDLGDGQSIAGCVGQLTGL